MNAAGNRIHNNALAAAQIYHARGWAPIPIPPKTKAPKIDAWQTLRLRADELPRLFSMRSNVGVLLGEPSGNLIDVDLDRADALDLADIYLPPTCSIFGRASKPRSHREYRVDEPIKTMKRQHEQLGMIVELRSTGCQTVFPGSVHPSGEPIAWDSDGDPALVDADVLVAAVNALADEVERRNGYQQERRSNNGAPRTATSAVIERARKYLGKIPPAVSGSCGHNSTYYAACTLVLAFGLDRKQSLDLLSEWNQLCQPPWSDKELEHKVDDALNEPGERGYRLRHSFTSASAPRSSSSPGRNGDIEPDPWPDPLETEAFHGLAGDIVRTIEPHSEADPVALLVQVLGVFGNIIGRSACFAAEADRHFGNLFVSLVGTTSKGRKGTSWGQVGRLGAIVDDDWSSNCIKAGLSSGEGLIWAVRDEITKLVDIKKNGRVVEQQEVVADPGVADKRLLTLESELSSVLKVVTREKNTLSSILRQAWETGNLRTLTKNSPAKATGAHISLIGHITRDELRRLITETDLGNGLANRFLWICVRRSKLLPEGGWLTESALAPLASRLHKAMAFARSVERVERDDEARELWAGVYGQLSAGKAGLLGAATSRAEAQTMRLAMLYALLDLSPVIRVPHLVAGLAVWQYAEQSARYVFGSALGDPTADEILTVLRRTPEGITRNDIREYFGRNKSAEEISRALAVLVEGGAARSEKKVETGGRPAELWFSC